MTAKTVALKAEKRLVTGKKVKSLRTKGQLPAVVYGHGLDATSISIAAADFRKAYQEAGTSTLVDLQIGDDKPLKVLFHEPQQHHLLGTPLHVDLYAVKMTEKIETAIPIHFTGVAPAVDELEGNFIANKDELLIRCLPGDLIPSVELDISVLKTFDDQIRVSDIKVPETVEVMDDAEDVVALVQAPISEEELEAELAPEVGSAEAEAEAVAELGKEGEEPAEGEAAAEGEPAKAETKPE
ncbi:MAG TPA: 50S ribosomal protein L25 [Candidatus Saccharimonadales bacterium]|nr:50S ribosomal protein L25 [Candidatus Saccharimonadales bacterium]